MKTKLTQTLIALAVGLSAASVQAAWTVDSSSGVATVHENNFNGGTSNYKTLKRDKSFSYDFDVAAADSSIGLDFWFSAIRQGASVALLNSAGSVLDLGLGPTTSKINKFTRNDPGPGRNDADDFFSLSLGSLDAGSYSLVFSTQGASRMKIDDIKLAVAPVPEPETYAMFLAGLALMGIVAARRARS